MQTIIFNGNIYLESGNYAQAILIENDVVISTGTNEEILKIASGDAIKIDAKGNAVVPGFNDSHQHLYGVGTSLEAVQLYGSNSIEEVLNRSFAFLEKNPTSSGNWILGRGWNQDYFSEGRVLTKEDLDKISTEHPILFTRACGHLASCNTKALEICGVTKDTMQIEGAEFYYGEDGLPNGVFTESAISLISSHIPEPSLEDMTKTLNTAMDYALTQGITTVQTNDIKDFNFNEMYAAYENVYAQNKARPRAYHQCTFANPDDFNAFLNAGFKTGNGSDYNKIGPLKMFVDGSLGARTAAMRNPYADDSSTYGIICMTQEQLNEMVGIANKNNLQVAVHAIGDKAIEMVLDSYDTVITNGENPLRHGIVHCQITDKPLLERFKTNDVLAYVQPIFIHYDMHIVGDRVGEELASTSYAFGDMFKMGINLSYGTDSPVEDLKTMDNLYCAVERKDLSGTQTEGYYIEQAVSINDAVHLYTAASAYSNFAEDKKGKLLPGFFADLAILDTDIFNMDTANLRDVNVDLTMVGGLVAYTRN